MWDVYGNELGSESYENFYKLIVMIVCVFLCFLMNVFFLFVFDKGFYNVVIFILCCKGCVWGFSVIC